MRQLQIVLITFLIFCFVKCDDSCVNLFKIDGNTCGEVNCFSKTFAPFAIKAAGLTIGLCKDQGYSNFDHSQKISAGPLGQISVSVYTKPSLIMLNTPNLYSFLSIVQDLIKDCGVTLYKITGSQCGMVKCFSRSYAPYAEKIAGLNEGDCNQLGYSKFIKDQTVSAGPLGSITVQIYEKQ